MSTQTISFYYSIDGVTFIPITASTDASTLGGKPPEFYIFTPSAGQYTTDMVGEKENLYFTELRSQEAIYKVLGTNNVTELLSEVNEEGKTEIYGVVLHQDSDTISITEDAKGLIAHVKEGSINRKHLKIAIGEEQDIDKATVTFTGFNAPSGAFTGKCIYSIFENKVDGFIKVEYATNGSVTNCSIKFPSNLPKPRQLSNWSNGEPGLPIIGLFTQGNLVPRQGISYIKKISDTEFTFEVSSYSNIVSSGVTISFSFLID